MSIIHDALKRAQQKLGSKVDNIQEPPPTMTQNDSGYLYEKPSEIETLPPSDQPAQKKTPIQNVIKSILALAFAVAITAASGFYIWQQVQTNAPKVQIYTRKSFITLIHKIPALNAKAKAPAPLKPLARLTIDAKTAPITLKIQGIMSKGNSNLVLIDDQVYQQGDEVDGAKIVKINLDSITVINNGTKQTIQLKN